MNKIVIIFLLITSATGYSQSPSFIPKPQQLIFTNQQFHPQLCRGIVYQDSSLQNLALQLQNKLLQNNFKIPIQKNLRAIKNLITLQLELPNILKKKSGAYQLKITKDAIQLSAGSIEGIQNGIQTLLQWFQSAEHPTCEISDWPAFEWRGFMVDVGRNYIPVEILKQLIDKMAFYKLNVFHFHATEDIAWRFEIKQYPELTNAANMLRNKGAFYTVAEIKELIQYCKDRAIRFIPEIDMPGHSAAFKRAFQVDMQSEEGIKILKNILREICSNYAIDYLHIGADEVKITNKNFIPTISAFVQSFGKKIIGWQPGGNFSNNTIRQLWMDDLGKITEDHQIKYIDSRHLYINHMDPLEAVTTLFNRQISNKDQGDSNALGAILCLWHDRKISEVSDLFKMNPVYPSLLAFSERSWSGGGTKGWIANISDGDTLAFQEFEQRLLFHQSHYFSTDPFPYAVQSKLRWTLMGPFNNKGNLSEKFLPEFANYKTSNYQNSIEVIGGTIVLRHWWAPLIKAAIPNPTDSSTWYASTSIWSDSACTQHFWIGFNNLSRSPATDTAPEEAWDNKGSCLWVNHQLIPAPKWTYPNRKGNSESPLIDEGYEYRSPTKIPLQKGWNQVLIKCPVGSFKGKDWQNPVKWMFTFIQSPKISE